MAAPPLPAAPPLSRAPAALATALDGDDDGDDGDGDGDGDGGDGDCGCGCCCCLRRCLLLPLLFGERSGTTCHSPSSATVSSASSDLTLSRSRSATALLEAALLEAARLGRAPFDVGAHREQAWRDATGLVGLGWMRTETPGERVVWHNGATGGFSSFVGYGEVSGRAVVLMANGVLDLDALGLHLINPAFRLRPPAAPPVFSRTGAPCGGGI